MENVYRSIVGNSQSEISFRRIGKIILRWIFEKCDMIGGIGFNMIGIGTSGGLF
jgi:hypothetical protein